MFRTYIFGQKCLALTELLRLCCSVTKGTRVLTRLARGGYLTIIQRFNEITGIRMSVQDIYTELIKYYDAATHIAAGLVLYNRYLLQFIEFTETTNDACGTGD